MCDGCEAELIGPQVQREVLPDSDEDEEMVDLKAQPRRTLEVGPEVASSISALRGGGLPLPDNTSA